jgi:hypothetical protein
MQLTNHAENLFDLNVQFESLRLAEEPLFMTALALIEVTGVVKVNGIYPTSAIFFLAEKMNKKFSGVFAPGTGASRNWKEHSLGPLTADSLLAHVAGLII